MKNFTIIILFVTSLLFSFKSSAQWQSILSENCDAASAPALPNGFTSNPADTTGWVTDATGTNASAGYSNDVSIVASGASNVVITNNTSVAGAKYLEFPSFSTMNFDSVSFTWGARLTKHFLDNGSTINLQYSTDGNNWTNISYTENTNDSNWYLDNNGKPVYLPADALSKPGVTIRFAASIVPDPSGTYRIDDVSINGHTSGTNTVKVASLSGINSFYNASTKALLVTPGLNENYDITVNNLLGQSIYTAKDIRSQAVIDLSKQADGVYFLSVIEKYSGVISSVKFNKY